MGFIIENKLLNHLRISSNEMQQGIRKLSTGKRLAEAKEDTASLSISVRMTSQIKGNEMARSNIDQGISLLASADGTLGTLADILHRIRELTLGVKNGTLGEGDREAVRREIQYLLREIDREAKQSRFNGLSLLDREPLVPAGVHWEVQASGTGQGLNAATKGGGMYVAAGNNGTILSSADGVHWTQRSSGVSKNLLDVVYNPAHGLFVATGVGTVLTSPDGIQWTERYSGGGSQYLRDVLWNGGQYVVGSNYFSNTVLTSPDGFSWSLVPAARDGYAKYGIAWNGALHVMVGDHGTIQTSANGINWTSRAPLTSDKHLLAVIYAGGQFVTVGTAGVIRTSPDGISWTSQPSGTSSDMTDVHWDGGSYTAVGSGGVILTSDDGTMWSPKTGATPQTLNAVYSDEDLYVSVGQGGTILTSKAVGDSNVHLHTGHQADAFYSILGRSNVTLQGLGLQDFDPSDPLSLRDLEGALNKVLSHRASIGTEWSRLFVKKEVLASQEGEYLSSRAKIEDADMAEAASVLARRQVAFDSAVKLMDVANTRRQSEWRALLFG